MGSTTIKKLEKRLKDAEKVLGAIAEGDLEQTIEMEHPDDLLAPLEMGINFLILDLKAAFDLNRAKETELVQKQAELEEQIETIERQAAAIQELSTPVMEVWDDILVLPIVGVVDTNRSSEIMSSVLASITGSRARCVIIDVTGVELVDTKTASYLLKVVRAARLLGARCVLTGLRPAVAQTLVDIGADLSEVHTLGSLKLGLKDCIGFIDGARGA